MLRLSRWFTKSQRALLTARLEVESLEHRAVPAVLTPMQVRHAYGFDQISFSLNGQTIKGDGAGQTIAIVDAYDDPNIFNDLNVFDRQFNIEGNVNLYSKYGSATSFLTKVTQGTPRGNVGWGQEISLDVEWAHAIAPAAKIMLVEANTSSYANLFASVNYARSQPGVVAVSMSWGSGEFSGETSYDTYFSTPTGHLGGSNGLGGADLAGGVTFVASSGDSGAPAGYPPASSKVVGVGGTTLNVDSAGNVLSETGWSGSGGGPSAYVTEPSFQTGFQSTGQRGTPDVSYDADPNTGFYVYDSYANGRGGWYAIGGTSAGSPQWAALFAIADQGRALAGQGSLDGPTQTLPGLYSLASTAYSTNFRDIVSGNNGDPAGTGYDFVTGLGSPIANNLVAGLVNLGRSGGSFSPASAGGSASGSVHASVVVFTTVSAADASVLFNAQLAAVMVDPTVRAPARSYAPASVVTERPNATTGETPIRLAVATAGEVPPDVETCSPNQTPQTPAVTPANPDALPNGTSSPEIAEPDCDPLSPELLPLAKPDSTATPASEALIAVEMDGEQATRLGLAGLVVAGMFLGCDVRPRTTRRSADRWSVDLERAD